MAATASHLAIGTPQSRGYFIHSGFQLENGNTSLRLTSNSFRVNMGIFRIGSYCSRGRRCIVAQASNDTTIDSSNKPNVPLTNKGVEEAIEAGKRISNIPIDVIHTSALIRAQMTAMLAMTQHRRKKVPIIMHNESEQAKSWSQIFSEETIKQCIPVVTAWQLNERMYGELQGLNKQETADRYGKEKVHEWRRSYDIPPPNGESLEMCTQRAVAYFKEYIEPQLVSGKNVMIAAHGNSLRSIIMYLDKLTSQEVISLELSTGIPMLYISKDGKFIRRGSPAGPTEAGVYAYTKRLAKYRQKLDDMSYV